MINRRTIIAAGSLIPAFLHAQPASPVRFGAILPVTGFGASYATAYRTAIEMAIADINAGGGISLPRNLRIAFSQISGCSLGIDTFRLSRARPAGGFGSLEL